MLRAQKKWDKRSSSAANYHYYREGHEEGVWVGRGAAMLGLFGPPTAKTLTAVASGLDPRTGKPLRQRQLAEGAARCTKDFAFSTPKSLSSLWMVAPPELQEKISRAQARAVLAAAKKLESLVCCRDRGAGAAKNAVHQTGVMVAAIFKHTTSRPVGSHMPDPHLHYHLVLANLTERNGWYAVQDQEILKYQKVIEAEHDAVLAAEVVAMGLNLEPDGNGSWRIAEVDRRVDDLFSKRRDDIRKRAAEKAKQIEAETGQKPDLKVVEQIVAHEGRKSKMNNLSLEELTENCRRQLKVAGIREDGLASDLHPAKAQSKAPTITARRALDNAVAHLLEREAVLPIKDVVCEAVYNALGHGILCDDIEAEINRLLRSGNLLKFGDYITTREALADETRLIDRAKRGRGRTKPILKNYQPSPNLSVEQNAAASAILTSCDTESIVRGVAGGGKTTTIDYIASEAQRMGRTVFIAAPQGRQARSLQTEGFRDAATLSKVLTKPLPKNSILILDEAGQTDLKSLLKAQTAVRAAGGKLVLVGDSRQHGSVGRGDALRHLERDSGIFPARAS